MQKLHGDLDWITLKAMEKDPNRRYPTAHALAEDIRRHLNNEPVSAGSPTIIYRLSKFIRRNRTQVIAVACVVVVVLLGLLSFKLYKQNIAGKQKLAEEKQNLVFQKAETILSSAEAYYGEGQYEQALEQTTLLLELVPHHMIRMLSEALNLDRQHYAARKMRALTYFALGDYQNTERDADKMTFVQPENPSGYALRAVALRQMGRYSEAIEDHNRAIELAGDAYPDIAELYDQRRETHFRMGNYEQALADARRCVEKQPGAGKYKSGLLGALTALGRYSEADAENATPPGVLTYHYIPWLAKYVADGFESGRELALPDRTETGPAARLLRAIHRGYQEFY
jgi:tetratricopeptide (TPR) repeat protein